MSRIDELKQLAIEADSMGDQATAMAAMDKIEELIAQPEAPLFAGQGQIPPEQARAMGAGMPEVALTMVTGAIAEPVSGLAGLGDVLTGGSAEEATQTIEETRKAMTYEPKSEAGKETLSGIATAAAPIAEAVESVPRALGDFTMELTGSPELAAAAYTAPIAALEFIGLKGIQKLRKGTKLIDDIGRPTKKLRKALDKQGLDYDLLSPEAKKLIPKKADPTILGGKKPLPSEQVLIQEIKSGSRQDALAPLKVIGNQVEVDKIAKEAIRQGFDPGVIQSVKAANPATKAKMGKMVDIMRQVKKEARKGVDVRPSNVVGDAVTKRVKHIRDTASTARKELNNIARTDLPGKPINSKIIVNAMEDALDDLDVSLTGNGVPTPIFKGSQIAKDRTSQRVIKDVIDLLGEGGAPDALRAHKLKKQLDNMLDFRKKSATGLTDAGKKVAKKIRAALNDSVREVSPDYARVNDTLSQSLGALDEMDDAIGTIDLFGKGADKAVGTKMRALMSNQVGRVKLENALNTIDDTASALGGKFNDNVKDLVMFSDALNDRFGTPAKTGFAGQITQSIKQASREGVGAPLREQAVEAVAKGAEKLRGINDFNAFESMSDLLK